MESSETTPGTARVHAPKGIFAARMDDRGRLKLPAAFKAFLDELGAKDLFVTSFDERIGRIYTPAIWESNEKHLTAPGENRERRRRIYTRAMANGEYSKIDDQSRVLVNTDLRRSMGIEGEPVRVMFYDGVIQFWSEPVHAEMMADARNLSPADIEKEEELGLR
jgi:MraZ protein